MALVKYRPDAVKALNEYIYEANALPDSNRTGDDHIACLYLRYCRRELSWATFLQLAGDFMDGGDTLYGGKRPCEYYYGLLNRYEDAYFSAELEQQQATTVQSDISEEILMFEQHLHWFMPYFDRYAARHKDG